MRAVRGVDVNDDALALDAIDRVGPGGHYLADPHTIRYMRTEHYYPSDVFDRRGRDEWEADGATDAWLRAKARARKILAEHQPAPLDAEVDGWIKQQFADTLAL
jgi:trimethylamine--corrinoid protein Co-methyltransferase